MQNKCLGVFLVFLIFPFVILSIFFLSTQKLTSADFYKKTLVKTNSYAKTASLINSSNPNDALTKSLAEDVTPVWLEKNIEANLDILSQFINSKSNNLDLGLDVAPFRSDILKQIPAGINIDVPDRLTFSSYDTFLADFQKSLFSLQGQPSTVFKDSATIDKELQSSANLEDKTDENLINIKKGVHYFKIISYFVFALTLIWFILIGLVARRWPPAILRWAGWALFLPSASLAIILFFIGVLISRWPPLAAVNMSADVRQLVTPIYDSVVLSITSIMLFLAIIFSTIGFILIVISYLWGHFRPMPQPQVTPQTAPPRQ